jgi:hypothetical protein
MKSAVVSEGAASATSAATALIVPKQQLLLNNIHYHHHNDQARPIHPSSSSRRTIPQPSASTSRLSQAGTSRCMSTTSSQISVSDSTLPPLIFFSEMPIPLCNQFQSLNPLGQVGFHWKHFSAITTIGQKVISYRFIVFYLGKDYIIV